MKTKRLLQPLIAIATILLSLAAYGSDVARGLSAAAKTGAGAPRDGAHRKVEVSAVASPNLVRYRTERDYPADFASSSGVGNPIYVADNSYIQRDDYAIAILTGSIRFTGGCVTASGVTGDPCVTDPAGTVLSKKREVYTFRLSYLNPDNPSAAEVNLGVGYYGGDATVFTSSSDTATIFGGLFPHQPSCGMTFGKGYRAQIFLQASPYSSSADVPAGAQEWFPADTPATATRLAVPGKEVWVNHFTDAPRSNALRVDGLKLLSPEVEAHSIASPSGYQSTTGSSKHPIVSAGETDLYVTVEDCGTPFANVPFLFLSQPSKDILGHVHNSTFGGEPTGAIPTPPSDAIANVPAYVAGYTGSDGHSQPFHVTAGHYGGAIDISVHTDSLVGFSWTTDTGLVVGFPWLTPFTMVPEDLDLKVGASPAAAAIHPIAGAHYAVPELFEMVRFIPTIFRTKVDPSAKILSVNDMSLPHGGHFDLNGDWKVCCKSNGYPFSHTSHRTGFDVDFDGSYTAFDGTHHSMTVEQKENFKNAVEQSGVGRFLMEKSIHFRLPEDVIDSYLEQLK